MSVTLSVQGSRPRRMERRWQERGFRILLVDNQERSRELLRTSLSSQGHRVFEATTGQEALANAGAGHLDLVILDLALPDVASLDVIGRLRERSDTPILVISACDLEEQKVAVLDAGADDYLTRPFGMAELLARVRAALRRPVCARTRPVIVRGDLTVDVRRRRVTVADREVMLTPVEYSLLKALAVSAGTVLIHRRLFREVWGRRFGSDQDLNLLRVSVNKLRQKIEPDPARPRYLLTEIGVGYRLQSPA